MMNREQLINNLALALKENNGFETEKIVYKLIFLDAGVNEMRGVYHAELPYATLVFISEMKDISWGFRCQLQDYIASIEEDLAP